MAQFFKMNGLGNDFVIYDARKEPACLNMAREAIVAVCDRQNGIGCDQLIVMEPPVHEQADLFMRIFNPDGGEAGACGNASRCVAALYAKDTGKTALTLETIAGLLPCEVHDNGDVTVGMGAPVQKWDFIPLSEDVPLDPLPLGYDAAAVGMGNPHCVVFVEDADHLPFDLKVTGAELEHHPLFPERTNVEFISMTDRQTIRMRVWERGAGVTQACGSGACAAAIAAIRRGLSDQTVQIQLDGGNLTISWDGNPASHVFMRGPYTHEFEGQWPLSA